MGFCCGSFILTNSTAFFYPFGLTSIVMLHTIFSKFEKELIKLKKIHRFRGNSMKTENSIYVLLLDQGLLYLFMNVKIAKDGSIEVLFPNIKDSLGTAQTLQICQDKESKCVNVQMLDEEKYDSKNCEQCYISYHTSGFVNYHGMNFEPSYMQSLYNITEINPFFIYSFESSKCAFKQPCERKFKNPIIVNISELTDKRIDIVLSVCPPEEPLKNSNSFLISYSLYGLCVEILEDSSTLNLGSIYGEEDCVKIRPRLDKYAIPVVSKNKAFLEYQHAIYKTEQTIVLPPNGEGILEIIFVVEMRIPPWVEISFRNSDFSIEIVKRTTANLKFKVFDNKKHRYIKNKEEILIEKLILDADIYDDDNIPPPGCV